VVIGYYPDARRGDDGLVLNRVEGAGGVDLGFGRIVVSGIAAPITLANPV
jgi:hypothetical protein